MIVPSLQYFCGGSALCAANAGLYLSLDLFSNFGH